MDAPSSQDPELGDAAPAQGEVDPALADAAPAQGELDPAAAEVGPVPADVARLPFDKALEELRQVVARLEAGGLPLEGSIALYERGVVLHDHCSHLLDSAELRVQRLVDAAGGAPRALDLTPDDGEEP
jgi:exodeoxyribonuclease VII small subunit